MPLAIYGDYVVNTASGVKEDTGWLIGTKLGKAKNPGSWDMGYEYRDSESDSVVGAFSPTLTLSMAEPSGKGHKFSYRLCLSEKYHSLAFTYFLTDRDAGGDDKRDDKYKRMQLDSVR